MPPVPASAFVASCYWHHDKNYKFGEMAQTGMLLFEFEC